MKEEDYTLLTLRPPLSSNMMAPLEAWWERFGEEGQSLDPASTAAILYPTVEIAERALTADPLRLPREASGIAVVFLLGSLTGSIKANTPHLIVGFVEKPRPMTLSDTAQSNARE